MNRTTITLCLVCAALAGGAGELADRFRSPPRTAAPHVWWHWMNGNVTKEGITADLEAMKDIGLAGAQSFDCGCGIPFGGVRFASEEWFDMVKHAHNEAKRLGVELCLANCSGYSSSGGPWVTPEDAMKEIVTEETTVEEGESPVLPIRLETNGFYRDIAVVAFPTPKDVSEASAGVGVRYSRVSDSKKAYEFDFGSPREFSELCCSLDASTILWGDSGDVGMEVEVSGDDGRWRSHAKFSDNVTPYASMQGERRFYRFPKVSAAKARVTFSFAHGWGCNAVRINHVALGTFGRIPDYAAQTLYFVSRSRTSAVPDAGIATVDRKSVVVVKPDFDAEGRLAWRAPAGRWTVIRVGFRCSGRFCNPASDYGRGLEVDKLDAAALERFYNAYVGRLVKTCGIDPKSDPVGRAGFNMILVDSWEVGSQNWTAGFEDVFERARGYSLVEYLPVFAGFAVGSAAETERFCRDFRRTVEDAFAENYADKFAALCHGSGLLLEIEPYSSQPCSVTRYGRNIDCPASEFWCVDKVNRDSLGDRVRYISSIGHVRGRKYIGAESFTSWPTLAAWRQTPWSYKSIGDLAYASGVNRIIYHRYAHQPWTGEDAAPGMTMGQWGTHFERTVTWWPYAKDWITYQTRCQLMLQEGRHLSDVLIYTGSQTPLMIIGNAMEGKDGSKTPIVPEGYDYDFIGPDSVSDIAVTSNGALRVPGGVEYAAIAVPDREIAAVKIPGAKIVPWSGVTEFLAKSGIEKSLETGDESISWIRRAYDDGSEAWFVATCAEGGCKTDVVLRETSGRAPQLWDAVTGGRELAAFERLADGRARVHLDLPPRGSRFIVFSEDMPPAAVKTGSRSVIAVDGPWKVEFLPPRRGAPESVALDSLVDLSKHNDPGVRYFSGTCVYKRSVKVDPEAMRGCVKAEIDLGAVGEIARVKANGVYAPVVAWMKPCRADITEAVRKAAASGSSSIDLEIEVVNTWVNRIVGDIVEGYSPDWTWNGNLVAAIPEYVRKGESAPSGRHCFYTYRHYTENDADKIPPSGLMGPVGIEIMSAGSGE